MDNTTEKKQVDYWRRRALVAELSQDLEEADALEEGREIEALRARLSAIETSRSWKITAPLRKATGWISRRRNPYIQPEDEPLIERDAIQHRIKTLTQYAEVAAIEDWNDLLQERSR